LKRYLKEKKEEVENQKINKYKMAEFNLKEYLKNNPLLKEVEEDKELQKKVEQIVKSNLSQDRARPFINIFNGWDDTIMGKIQIIIGNQDLNIQDFEKIKSELENLHPNLKIVDSDHKYEVEMDDDRVNYPTIKFEIPSKGEVSEDLTNEDEIRSTLEDYGSTEEINQYFDSIEFMGEEFDTLDDYVEDFQNYC